MNKTNKLKFFTIIVFYGSLWGILEATFGYFLHFVPTLIAGSVMFPVASYILYKGYQKTQSRFSLLYMGVVASAIKAIDLLLPQFSYFKTINPMISIILESLVVVLIVNMVVSKKPVNKYLAFPIASISWRTLYVLYMGVQFVATGFVATQIASFSGFANFVLIQGLISGAIASMLIYLDKYMNFNFKQIDRYPLIASFLLVIALVLTYTL